MRTALAAALTGIALAAGAAGPAVAAPSAPSPQRPSTGISTEDQSGHETDEHEAREPSRYAGRSVRELAFLFQRASQYHPGSGNVPQSRMVAALLKPFVGVIPDEDLETAYILLSQDPSKYLGRQMGVAHFNHEKGRTSNGLDIVALVLKDAAYYVENGKLPELPQIG